MTRRIFILLAAVTIATAAAGQTRRMAVTALSENMMRAMPDYESALETQSLMGTVVEIVGEQGYWRQVVTPEPYTAWCTDLGLVEMSQKDLDQYMAAPKYICTAHHSGVYASQSRQAARLSDLSMGCLVRVAYTAGKNPKPSVKSKWAEVVLPDGRKGWTPLEDLAEFEKWASRQSLTQDHIISTAMQFEGTPYLWGGASSKGLDCSGLVRLTFFMNGYLLPRNASQQINYGREIVMEANHAITPEKGDAFRDEMTRRIKHLQKGDLVFFGTPDTFLKKGKITHVGLYIGDGKIIHASHKVRINSLIPGEADYYENSHKLVAARRFISYQGKGLIPILQSPAYCDGNL